MPLTNSLYVKGNISRPDRVLVDIGTGFYVEKVSKIHALPLGPLIQSAHNEEGRQKCYGILRRQDQGFGWQHFRSREHRPKQIEHVASG